MVPSRCRCGCNSQRTLGTAPRPRKRTNYSFAGRVTTQPTGPLTGLPAPLATVGRRPGNEIKPDPGPNLVPPCFVSLLFRFLPV